MNGHIFFRTSVERKLFDIGSPYKHYKFVTPCLPVKMAVKTVIRPILNPPHDGNRYHNDNDNDNSNNNNNNNTNNNNNSNSNNNNNNNNNNGLLT